ARSGVQLAQAQRLVGLGGGHGERSYRVAGPAQRTRPPFPSGSTGAASYPRRMAFDLVLFGGTGDLTWRKLMPALFQAWRHGKLPEGGRIVAVSRQELSDEAYRAWLKERFHEVEDAK